MIRFYLLLSLILFPLSSFAGGDWALPNGPSSGIGDNGTFYLSKDGLTFQGMNNDILGFTDKLNTGSTSLFFFKKIEDYTNNENRLIQSGLELSIHGRLITPIIETRVNGPKLNPPPKNHFYADWLEFKTAYAKTYYPFKFEVSLSVDDYGNNIGRTTQTELHKIVGAANEQSQFGQLSYGTYVAATAGVGYFINKEVLGSLYFQETDIMESWILRASYMKDFANDLSFGADMSLVNQVYSHEYKDDITPFRAEAGFGIKWHWYQMNIGYVTPYLKYDQYGQFYINPFIFHFEF